MCFINEYYLLTYSYSMRMQVCFIKSVQIKIINRIAYQYTYDNLQYTEILQGFLVQRLGSLYNLKHYCSQISCSSCLHTFKG